MSATLIVNPRVRLNVTKRDGAIDAVSLRAPVKGDRLRVNTIEREKEPAVFGVLLIYSLTGDAGEKALGLTERARLAEIGFLIRQDQVSEPVSFECDVDDMPAHFPATSLESLGESGPTAEMRGRLDLPNPFRRDRMWYWTKDLALAAPSFYSSSPKGHALEARPHLPAGSAEARAEQLATAHDELVGRRYTVLHELIKPAQLGAIRRYYRRLIAEGFVQFGDQDWPDRYFAKRDSLAYCFHQQLKDVISEIAGEPVKPSFAFLTSYCAGATLHAHKDREQCYYSLSVLLDHQPEPTGVSPWPIYVQPPGATEATPIFQRPGDGLLYFGQEVLHYRKPLPEGQSTLWFFFYVPEAFEGPLD